VAEGMQTHRDYVKPDDADVINMAKMAARGLLTYAAKTKMNPAKLLKKDYYALAEMLQKVNPQLYATIDGQLSDNDYNWLYFKAAALAANAAAKQGVAENKRVARKSGQPADSKKHSDLYTDENPRGTITGLKFATVADARASVSKIRNSGRSHAHKIQAAVAMEQRARAAGKSEEAAVYRGYINANKKTDENVDLAEDLRDWFGKGKGGGAGGGGWDRYNTKGERIGKCGDRKPGEGKPKCLSKSRAASLRSSGGKSAIASAVRRKRAKDKDPDRSGQAQNVASRAKKS